MTKTPKTPATPTAIKPEGANKPEGERIAKVLSRAGVASRREAERMIQLGQVAVNGRTIDSPALNVTPADRITIDGEPVAAAEPARLWLYYKPQGLVTSASDEKGRSTVFEHLPEELPRVMSIGRLDLNSEGLLLLTNDGTLKRRLELPSTGWLRKYRVRIKGNPTDPDLEPLRQGITVEGERFQPMIVTLDRIQGANAWLTVGLREGKNREIRRALNALDLTVNRLIRVSYGPFRLGDLEPGAVEEVRGKVLRDQLGYDPETGEAPAPAKVALGAKPARTRAPRSEAPRPPSIRPPSGSASRTPHGGAVASGRANAPTGTAAKPARGKPMDTGPKGQSARPATKPSSKSFGGAKKSRAPSRNTPQPPRGRGGKGE